MVPLKRNVNTEIIGESCLSGTEADFLSNLRFLAMTCRVKARAGLFEACALLQSTRRASQEACADALVRCLSEALGQTVRFHAPGTDELTFDERWLLSLRWATASGNEASVSFLLGRRVLPEHRRLVRFLMGRMAGNPH